MTKRDPKGEYLAALIRLKDPELVLAELGMTIQKLRSYRRSKDFQAEEMAILSGRHLCTDEADDLVGMLDKQRYLGALYENQGNQSKARQAAGVRKGEVLKWRAEDPKFRESESETMEAIVDEVEEQSTRLATGNNPRTREPKHVQWLLERVKKDVYGPQPKVHEHRYSGAVNVTSVDAQILELLGDADAIEPPK